MQFSSRAFPNQVRDFSPNGLQIKEVAAGKAFCPLLDGSTNEGTFRHSFFTARAIIIFGILNPFA
jgi:hypothetical protein